jgi:NAD-dependent deacetylase
MKPGFTLFGEAVPAAAYLEAKNLASFSDVFMVIGTSAVVQPAADLPVIAKENGAFIVELNSSETGLTNYITDCFIRGAVEDTLPGLHNDLCRML